MTQGPPPAPMPRRTSGRRWHLIVLSIAAGLLLVFTSAWFTLANWLPPLARYLLPDGVHLTLASRAHWQQGALTLPGFRLRRSDCDWVQGQDLRVRRHKGIWQLSAAELRLNSACSEPQASNTGDQQDLLAQLAALPAADVNIDQLVIDPWQVWAGTLKIHHRAQQTELNYHGDKLAADLRLQGRQVTVDNLRIQALPGQPPVRLQGQLTLAPGGTLNADVGAMRASLQLPDGTPLDAAVQWQERQGVVTLQDSARGITLTRLPWRLDKDAIVVEQGNWRWPYSTAPLAGAVNFKLDHWRAGLSGMILTARLNLLTQGLRGRANAVLTVGPGPLRLVDNQLDFRLTGLVNLDNLSLDAAIPGQLRGSLADPTLALLPGALLRLVGQVSDVLDIHTARLPLAGIQISGRGMNGRLQAILQANAVQSGQFTLHMDGKAEDFWPDSGHWQWRYWGAGQLPAFASHWRLAGRGHWVADQIEIGELSATLDRLNYGLMQVASPRLSLLQPLRWKRNAPAASFAGKLRLSARRISLERGGYLPQPTLELTVDGRDPQQFNWRGILHANPIGPVRLQGRWDGQRLRGQAWWPPQPLRVLQPLLNPALQITLRAGEFYAQSAFSAAAGQGFLAGGHGVLSGGDIWVGDNRLTGLRLSASYRLQDSRWQLGVKQPIALHIATLTSPIAVSDIDTGLQGYYPWDDQHPLRLTHVRMQALGGNISLSPLRLPQRETALLQIHSIEMSELITALKPKQFAMSGRVSGELPLSLNDDRGWVLHGWIANDNLMTLRLDPQFADALGKGNLASGAAIDWLRYLEINKMRADIDVARDGELLLRAGISGNHPQRSALRAVNLNYQHQENLFQLWRSLRFGSNVEQTLEKAAADAEVQRSTHKEAPR